MKYGASVTGKGKTGLRQTGEFEIHPTGCNCRKCRRRKAALARRSKPRYGQRKDTDE